MKYIVILGDGMADEPIDSLGGRTPLQVADKPVMDKLANDGDCGLLSTIPDGFAPGSEIANMGVLGYDVTRSFEGRGSLEAASMGVNIPDGWMAARCNLICINTDGTIKNHSAGHISNEEAAELIAFLNRKLSDDKSGLPVTFYPGVSYRHLLLMKGGDKRVKCTPPHDVPGTPYKDVLVKPLCEGSVATAARLNELIERSQELLAKHPINLSRAAEGKDMANSIWPWSPGYRPSMRPMTELYPIRSGSVISAVDLIKGIGIYAGLESIDVEGATGLYDTNYEGKAAAAIAELRKKDFVFVHVEAPDEASHDGNVELKIRTIQDLDKRLIRPIYEEVKKWEEPVTIAVLPDHPTYCRTKTHVSAPVPFLIWRSHCCCIPDLTISFNEEEAKEGSYGLLSGDDFIRSVFGLKL